MAMNIQTNINQRPEMIKQRKGIYRRFIKRPMDFILALLAIVILSPILLIVAILVRTKLGSPILFKQERPGLDEEIFTMYKFRTMTDETDENGDLLPNNERHTKFGRILRSTSLDELPELFNILKGDMSFVGPRPLLVEYLPLYNEYQRKRHDVRPGLSGLAQVSGRNAITWEEKFDYDIEYVENISFIFDLKILIKTFFKVFKREGINSSEVITMEKFRGTGEQHIQ
jgi:undecaprenyl phosphate N,N'-diacetylbacillosamine 1-phosphate transferase